MRIYMFLCRNTKNMSGFRMKIMPCLEFWTAQMSVHWVNVLLWLIFSVSIMSYLECSLQQSCLYQVMD